MKTSVFLVGIVVLASINFVKTPPNVSIPKERGVTSNSNTSFTSPVSTAPWIAAPIATTSSGFTPLEGVLPKKSSTIFCTIGIRVEPPTKITSSISEAFRLASSKAFLHGSIVDFTKSSMRDSNFALVNCFTKCFGTLSTVVIYGRLISVIILEDNSILARSAASFNLCSAKGSFLRSTPSSFINSSANQFISLSSKSSPPSLVLPLVDLTMKTPSPSSRILISKVPPPRS